MSTLEQEYIALLDRFGITFEDRQGSLMSDQELYEAYLAASAAKGVNVVAGLSFEEVKKILAPVYACGSMYGHELSEVVESAMERQLRSQVDVWAGRFPTGCLNAQAVRVKSGVLLLVNTGLEDWLHRMANVYVSSIHFGIIKDKAVIDEPCKSEDEVTQEIAALVFEYLVARGVSNRPMFSLDAGARGMVTYTLAGSALTFVLAHEYAHATGGHLNPANEVQRAVVQSGRELKLIEKSWKQEYEADAIGWALLLSPSRLRIASRDDLLVLSIRAMGPFLFLGLALLVESVVNRLEGGEDHAVVVSDHPPTSARIGVLRDAWTKAVPNDVIMQLPKEDMALFPQGLLAWFGRITSRTTDLVLNKLQSLGWR